MKSPVILRVFKNNQLTEVKQFDQAQIVIGSDDEAQFKLQGPGVSPIHCLVELRDGKYFISDLGSQSGTFKNGQAVLDEALNNGDSIGVGPYKVVFFLGVPKAVAPGAPTPTAKPQDAIPETPIVPSKPPAKPVTASKPAASSIPEHKASAKPNLKSRSSEIVASKRKGKKTFAPASEIRDLKSYLKPGRGPVLEVIVTWKERILNTYHFKDRGVFRIGHEIQLPDPTIGAGWQLVDIGTGVRIGVSHEMQFELITSQGKKTLDEVSRMGKGQTSSVGTIVRLDQNEMICLSLSGGLIQIYIRYAPQAPVVPMMPPLMLSSNELMGILTSIILVAILAFYISAKAPKVEEQKEEELTRVAQVIFNKPPESQQEEKTSPPPPEKTPQPPPKQEKAVVSDQKMESAKKGQSQQTAAQKNQTAGRAAEVAPIPNAQNRPKKFTSVKQGGAIKLGPQQGSNAQTKDISKVGIFSAFGGGGNRAKLDTAYSGAGEILGQADKATGSSGMDSNRSGNDLGSKFKDTGAGGKGTATEGIAGINTKGSSTGQSAYGDLKGFGDKTTVSIEPGEAEADFEGTIDREAVRRRVKHYLYEIRGCYVRELSKLEKGQRLEGKVVVKWEIIAKGAARNVQIDSSTLNNKNVENCIRQRLANWSFPEPPVGMTAEVTYPFYFRPEL